MNRALFLDRDGVINHDSGYTHKKEGFIFIDGIFDLCRSFYRAGYMIFIVTNQAGIARGYYSEQDFLELTEWVHEQFLSNGSQITKTYYCPYHIDAEIPEYKKDSFYRKPNPGMILQARDEFSLDLKNSVLIGDKEHDIQAGRAAGVGKNIIIGKPSLLACLCFNSVKDAYTAKIWE